MRRYCGNETDMQLAPISHAPCGLVNQAGADAREPAPAMSDGGQQANSHFRLRSCAGLASQWGWV